MTDSRTGAGNLQKEPWACCSARKWESAKKQTNKIPPWWGIFQRDTGAK